MVFRFGSVPVVLLAIANAVPEGLSCSGEKVSQAPNGWIDQMFSVAV